MFNFESTQTHMKEVPVALFLPFSQEFTAFFYYLFLAQLQRFG